MAAAGYVEYEPATSRFTLPAEHAAAVAAEGGPFFFGGIYEMFPAFMAVFNQVAEVFHKGGGVRQADYPPAMRDGLERFTAGWFCSDLEVPHKEAIGLDRSYERGFPATLGVGHSLK
jgi:hypothetical protein